MDWLICLSIAILAGASNIFVDNYISDYYFKGRDANAQKNFYIIPFLIIGIICLCAVGINLEIPFYIYLLIALSGAITAFAGIFYYKALELSESTDFGIFAQLSPVFCLVLGWLFLDQNITSTQFIAFLIIFAAPILIIFTTKKRSRQTKIKAIIYAILDVLVDAISIVIFVKFNTDEVNFITGMGFVYIGKSLGNAIIMLLKPKWRKRYHYVVKSSHRKIYYPYFAELLINTTNLFAKNFALILAPSIALTSAIISSARPIVIFFLGLLFTILWPRFGREKMTRKTILVHLIATILVVIGICLIQTS